MKNVRVLATIALCLAIGKVATAAEAGNVIFVRGDVTAERTPPVGLAKSDAVLDDDTVATGDASRAQLLLTDGAKIAIRPNSRLRIDEYVFAGQATGDPDNPVVSTSGDRSVATLIKGGFRTITGAIGKENEEDYEVRTPVGVLGIRGTDYSAVFCNGDCNFVPGVNPNAPIEDGLYLGVTEGAIFFRNENGDIELQAGEYAFIPLTDRVPVRLDAQPPVLLADNDLRFDANGNLVGAEPQPAADGAGALTGFDSALGTRRAPDTSAPLPGSQTAPEDEAPIPAQSIDATDADGSPIDITPGDAPRPNNNRIIGYSTGPLSRGDTTWSTVLDNEPSQYRLNAANELTGFSAMFPAANGAVPADIDLGTASIVESGLDSTTVLRWGRWSGGVASVDLGGGATDAIDLASQSLHWVSGGEAATPPVMPITGNASYSLLGNTAPTDNLGNIGVLGSATFDANFTNMSVDSTLVVDINQVTWTAAGTGAIGPQALLPPHMFSGSYLVTVGGSTSGSGQFSGFFSTPGTASDPTFPGGAGLTYSLQDMGGTTSVSGAAVFGNP